MTYIILLNDLRSGCTVEMESYEICDVGFPKLCSSSIEDSLGMSGKTLLSTSLFDAMMCGLHWMNVSLIFIQPGAQISFTRDSEARYTHILPPPSLDVYFILLPPVLSAMVRRYYSIEKPPTASKITPCFLCAYSLTGQRVLQFWWGCLLCMAAMLVGVVGEGFCCGVLPSICWVCLVVAVQFSAVLLVLAVFSVNMSTDLSLSVVVVLLLLL
jgi:hypothetical protein